MCEICDGQSPEEAIRDLRRSIDRHGWALQYVESAIDDCGVHAAFCYTVGLCGLGHPEIVITGRVPDQSAVVLNSLAERVWRGSELVAGERFVVGGLEVCLVSALECESWLDTANEIYGEGSVTALQAVWADCQGLLPWEGPISSTIVQPLLGPPPGGRVET